MREATSEGEMRKDERKGTILNEGKTSMSATPEGFAGPVLRVPSATGRDYRTLLLPFKLKNLALSKIQFHKIGQKNFKDMSIFSWLYGGSRDRVAGRKATKF